MKRSTVLAVAIFAAVTSAPVDALQSNQPIGKIESSRALSEPGLNSPGDLIAGTVVGTVRDARGGQPLASVQVSIVGTSLGTLTDADGRYTLQNVPAGQVRIVATLIGYTQVEHTITVQDNASTTADFQMSQSAVLLDEVVVTGTAGGTQRRAIGNVVTTVNVDQVTAKSPVGNVDQLLAQRTPGLMMMPGTGQVGTGSQIRIRGNTSLDLSNEPIVYIDGVRMDSDAGRGPSQRGGANVSRLNDINPADIQSIEIIKGPAAATLYGTEASNGVIQIITKRGATGEPQFDVSTRFGTNWLWNPAGRTGMRYMLDGGELVGVNVYEHEAEQGNGPIFGYGNLLNYSVSVRGGTDAVRYYASAARESNTGVVDWNWDRRITLRANMEMLMSNKVTVAINTSYLTGQTRLAQGSIDTDPFSNLIWSNPRNLDARRGFLSAPPEEWRKVQSRADHDRTTANVELRYQPFSWFKNRLIAGLDLNNENNWTLIPRQPEGADHFYGADALGVKDVDRGTRRFITLDYAGSVDLAWRDFSFQPSVGFQFYKTESSFVSGEGENFAAPPLTTIGGGAVTQAGESFVENATVGVYVQQQVGWKNRVFITGAVRGDDNSAFGQDYDAAIYPKFSGTWVVHEEPFWNFDFVNQLRLRTAWGAAGQQPGTFDATRTYVPEVGYDNQPSLLPGEPGNPQLKPERSQELELGFDATLLNGRLDLVYTRYQRTVKDAIVSRPIPPSSGFTSPQIINIGEVSGWGNEVGVVARLLQGEKLGWEVDLQYATMRNRIEDLGELTFIGGGGQSQNREGYSIGDFFMRRILDVELNEDGTVASALCDGGQGPDNVQPGGAPVPCLNAPQVWWGRTQPTWTFGLGNTFTLFGNLQLYARVEGNGGHYQANTEIRATHNLGTSAAVLLRNDPLLQATRIYENDATGTYKAGFLRLREISATYHMPTWLAGRVGANSGSVSLGMRNVMMLWTAEHGWNTYRDGSIRVPVANRSMITWDPEVRANGQASTGYQTVLPPTASLTMSIRLSF